MKITTGFLTGNLLSNAGPGIDRETSARRFAERLARALSESFPGAEVRVDWRDASGFLPPEFWTAVNFDPGHELVDEVNEVIGKVIQEGGYCVREEEVVVKTAPGASFVTAGPLEAGTATAPRRGIANRAGGEAACPSSGLRQPVMARVAGMAASGWRMMFRMKKHQVRFRGVTG